MAVTTVETDIQEALRACDREPIHIPGSIQPHGMLFVADPVTLETLGGAGDIDAILEAEWEGELLDQLLDIDLRTRMQAFRGQGQMPLGSVNLPGGSFNAVGYKSGDHLVVELDRAEEQIVEAVPFLARLDGASSLFERAANVAELCRVAAQVFSELTGYSRVMVYQFLDDQSGTVVAEKVKPGLHGFMNHHFPASDIPKQARALYVRNRVRVIPDVGYIPRPILSRDRDLSGLDLSDSTLRSVSPVHIQYLKNMGVAASASISIVKDGFLWGLIACHDDRVRPIPLSIRMGCQALANALARQIKTKEEAELYRERIRLRANEDAALTSLGRDGSLDEFLAKSGPDLARLFNANGFAAVQGKDVYAHGICPEKSDVRKLAQFVCHSASVQPFSTTSLTTVLPEAQAYADRASGLLAVTMSTEVPTILMWFRAEHVEVVKWAGDPHKNVALEPGEKLTPRASFDAWSQTVRGKARAWSHAEAEAAARLVRLMLDQRNNQRMRELNKELATTLRENESLLRQKDFFLGEVNHRVQNSLQLVSAFLRLQARSSEKEEVRQSLEEARKRLSAVALVHRRLYQDGSVEVIDLSRYIETLMEDTLSTMDADWRGQLVLDLAPVLISTDRAVNIGLVLTELVINAQKYAYGGKPGPVHIQLEQHRDLLRLIVSDQGRGKQQSTGSGSGFGTGMLRAIMERLDGHIDEEDNEPGLRVVVTARIG